MKIENQVCTLEQAVKFFNYGIGGSFMSHYSTKEGQYLGVDCKRIDNNEYVVMPAFNVAELGAMLPTGYDTMRVTEIDWKTKQWHGYDLDGKDFPSEIGYATESECRAAMVLRLLETNEIMSAEINECLSNS